MGFVEAITSKQRDDPRPFGEPAAEPGKALWFD
jgi:hypothetical protein